MNQEIISLNEGWRFHYGDVPEAWYKGFDDGEWEEIFLPHDWSVHMPFREEYSSGTGYLAGGIGWYRLHFTLPERYRGKRIRIVFDGIYKNSRVWCNSYHLGKRPYGYSEISYDITEFVNFGEEGGEAEKNSGSNVLCVQVTHTDLADSRWFTGSGIYRKAWLLAEEPVHPVLHGICFQTVSVGRTPEQAGQYENASHCSGSDADRSADIDICAELVNDGCTGCSVRAAFRLLDADGREAAAWEAMLALPAGGSGVIHLEGDVKGPHLWSVDSPYLYTLVTELSCAEALQCEERTGQCENASRWPGYAERAGNSWLAQKQSVGIRTIRFDPDEGFFLNEKNMKLKGVCVHHDGGCLGAAMYREVWLRRLLKLKEAGCNAIRTSHNPHMPELYDLCDELGFLVMDEAFDEWENPKNKWSTGHNVYPPKHQGYAEEFPQWYEADLTTMIRRDRNHPSVVMWSIGNEIDYPNDPYCHPMFQTMVGNNDADKPTEEMRYDPNKPDAGRLSVIAARLSGIAKNLDNSRPVTLAVAFPEMSSRIGFFDALDVVGYNYKEHLYDQDHKRFPGKPFLGSENGHSYQAWRAVTDHPYVSGQFLWTGVDYLGEAHGWPIHGSGAGILDMAGYEKPEYYRRKAWWSEKPYLCLLTSPAEQPSRGDGNDQEWRPVQAAWNYRTGEPVDVYCYTNQECAELFLNGESHGTGAWNETCGRFEWSLSFEPGTLKAVCPARLSSSAETDAPRHQLSSCVETVGSPARIEAKVWEPPENGRAACASDGMKQIEVTLLDGKGCLVQNDDKIIRAEVETFSDSNSNRNCVLLGLENGDLADLTPYTEHWRRTRGGHLILYVRSFEDTCSESGEGNKPVVKISCEELEQTVMLEI